MLRLTVRSHRLRRQAMAAALIGLVLPAAAHAQASAGLKPLQDEAVRHLQEYLRINTANPPGNEAEGMRFFARILAREGIPFDTVVTAPGRGNIWARIRGGSEPALLLLHHYGCGAGRSTLLGG